MSDSYHASWEGFWHAQPRREGEAIWDSHPDVTVERHAALFQPYFKRDLPVLDLSCGSGTQTRGLARHYPRVIGVDFAASALAHAGLFGTDHPTIHSSNPTYRRVDVRDSQAVAALRDETGDCNVYMRGVIHQLRPRDRPAVIAALVTLLGTRGSLFALELAPAAQPILQGLASRPGGPPAKLAEVFQHGLTPATILDGDLEREFTSGGLALLDSGAAPLHTTQALEDGTLLELPMVYIVARVDAAAAAG